MIKKGKEIDIDRFYWNPKTEEKVYSHYTDGSPIALSPEEKKKAEDASKACTARANRLIQADPKAREKPAEKRGKPKKEDTDKKE